MNEVTDGGPILLQKAVEVLEGDTPESLQKRVMEQALSLIHILQMPSGVPVATVAIDGAENAGLLAAQMLAIADENLFAKLQEKKEQMRQKVIEKDKKLQEKLQG